MYSWWAENRQQFPTLCQLARNLLALPATSVPSEHAFSKAGHIVHPRCARLTPSHVDELVFLSHNYRQLIMAKPSGFIVQSESESSSSSEEEICSSILFGLSSKGVFIDNPICLKGESLCVTRTGCGLMNIDIL